MDQFVDLRICDVSRMYLVDEQHHQANEPQGSP